VVVEGTLTENATQVILESLGTHVASTGVEDLSIAKHAGTGQGKKKLASKTEDPKSPPTANPKTLKKHGNTSATQTKGDMEEGMSDSIELKEGFAPQIITPDNIMFYQVVYGSIAALWLAGIVSDLPRTVGNMWNNAKRKYKDNQETSKAMQTDFAKLSDEILKNIPSEWSSQRKTHLKKLLNAAKTLSSATGEDKKIEYGKLVREIQRYMSVHGSEKKTTVKEGVEHGNTSATQTKGDMEEAAEKPAEPAKDKVSPEGKKMLNMQQLAYETLKKLVEKYPKKFPKIAKALGFKVKD
jgi:gas vesicle protein